MKTAHWKGSRGAGVSALLRRQISVCSLSDFLPEKLFGGSERAVTSENAPVERRELQVQPLPKPATAWWRNHHKPARNFLRRFNFEGSEDTVTSGKARKRLMVQLHQNRVRLSPSIPLARAVRAGLLHPN